MASHFPEVFDFILKCLNLEFNDKMSNLEKVCMCVGVPGLQYELTHLLVHIALMVFPGSGGLIDFSFTVDTVIH